MRCKQIAVSATLCAAIATLPFSAADAHRGRGFPLFWPFLAGAAVVGTAAAIATAPVRAVVAAPPYYYAPPPAPYYAPPPAPYYAPPAYYAPGYYAPYYR